MQNKTGFTPSVIGAKAGIQIEQLIIPAEAGIQVQTRKAFTLIELLVVIAIIALLLSILTPALNAVKDRAKSTVCQGKHRKIQRGVFKAATR